MRRGISRLVQPLLLQEKLEVPERILLLGIEVPEVAMRVAELVTRGADRRLNLLCGPGCCGGRGHGQREGWD